MMRKRRRKRTWGRKAWLTESIWLSSLLAEDWIWQHVKFESWPHLIGVTDWGGIVVEVGDEVHCPRLLSSKQIEVARQALQAQLNSLLLNFERKMAMDSYLVCDHFVLPSAFPQRGPSDKPQLAF